VVLRRDHGVRAGAIGDAQARAEVVRVGHAVEHEHERRTFDLVERVVERLGERERLDPRHHALVPMRAGELREPVVAALDDPHARLDRAGDEVLHPRVAPRRVDVQLEHRARRGLEAHADRVEAEQDARGHRPIVAFVHAVRSAGRAAMRPRRFRRAARSGASCRR
jgi:hypothetical protein